MSVAALTTLAVLALWVVPVGLVGVAVVGQTRRDLDAEDRIAVLLTLGVAAAVLGSQVLAMLGDLSGRSFVVAGVVLAAISLASFLASPALRSGIRGAGRSVHWMLLPIAVGLIAAAPELVNIVRYPGSLPQSTPWYYLNLAIQTVQAKGFPSGSIEWGISVPFLNDYPGFTALTAALTASSGRPDLIFGAQAVRAVAAGGVGLGMFYLARSWGATRFAATAAAFVTMATSVFAVKALSYRPESLSYLLVFFVLGLARRWLDELRFVYLVAGALAFVTLAQIHGIGWTVASVGLIASVLAHTLVRDGSARARAMASGALVGVLVLAWGVTTYILQGQLTQVSKLDTAPQISSSGVDPTWQFASFNTANEGQPPPTSGDLARVSVERGFVGSGDGLLIAISVVAFVLLVTAASHATDEGLRARVALFTIGLLIVGLILVSGIFVLGWATYVPRRTGASRMLQIAVFVVPLAAAVGASLTAGVQARQSATTLWFAASAVLLSLAAPLVSDMGSTQIAAPGMVTIERSLGLNDGLILANGYTEGFLPAVFGSPGLLDGRAPYTEASLLDRANTLLARSRAFFDNPLESDLDLQGLGVAYVVVTGQSWSIGTVRWFEANTFDLDARGDLERVFIGPGLLVYRVVDGDR
jgi:hypothetical protein